jgi:hypothetical protein
MLAFVLSSSRWPTFPVLVAANRMGHEQDGRLDFFDVLLNDPFMLIWEKSQAVPNGSWS